MANKYYIRKYGYYNWSDVLSWADSSGDLTILNTVATSPGTAVDDSTVGTETWTTPDNARVSDNTYTTNRTPSGPYRPATSHYLKLTNFNFSIPSNSIIKGIVVEIERKANRNVTANYAIDSEVKIVKADGSIGTQNKNSATKWSTSENYYSYGANNDTWGETWSAENINDIDFGVVLSVYMYSDGSSVTTISVDHVKITVYYTTHSLPTVSDDVFLDDYSGLVGGATFPVDVQANCKSITLANNVPVDFEMKFKESLTHNVGDFTFIGTSEDSIVINSVNETDQFNISSDGTVDCDYLDISNSNAIGGAEWKAGIHSINNINNDGWMFVPEVLIVEASEMGSNLATLNANIVDGGAFSIRGFEWGTESGIYTDSWEESGTFPMGTFNHIVTGLEKSRTYFFRAYATNATGTDYSDELSFTTTPITYVFTIDGVNRTGDVLNQTIKIEDVINDKVNTCSFSLIDRSGSGIPATDEEVIITIDGVTIFGGYIVETSMSKSGTGEVKIDVSCVDYTRLLDRNLVNKTYEDMTDLAIIEDLVNTYCPGFGITTTNVIEGVTVDKISFNYLQMSEVLKIICKLTGRNWYIDYDKDIHYFPLTTSSAPFNIDSTSSEYFNLKISKDSSQLKNRVYVRGGTKLSDPTTFSSKGDGVMRKFVLPDKPHDVSVTVNSVSKTLGIKNIDTSGYDWYLNFQEKYIEQDSGGTVLSTSDTLIVTYSYDIPILVAVEDTASILANGQQEFAIFDKTISTTQSARDRATAELTDYADNIVEGGFETYTTGFFSGQYLNIVLTDYEISDNYIVQSVVARSIGSGQFVYTIKIASSKTMGIIKFLMGLLEANKNIIEIDEDEVVDELLEKSDLLISDSLLDSLTIDSAGPYFTWCTDSLDSSPVTRARWELFSWGV